MSVDVQLIAGWAGAITALAAPVWLFLRRLNEFMLRIKALEAWTRSQQEDIERSRVELSLLLSGTLACLKGLKEQGCDGAVTKSIAEFEGFLLARAAESRSVR